MADTHAKRHDYHLVDPSPWPLLMGAAVLLLTIGAVRYMHGSTAWLMLIGTAAVVYTLTAWWRDVIAEAQGGYHTPVVQLHMRYGMIFFIISEIMFFVAWFWAYFDVSLYPLSLIHI